MAVAAPLHRQRQVNAMSTTPRRHHSHGNTPDDRSARLPDSIRKATVDGAENANSEDTAATSNDASAGRNDGPGGYAPTVSPDDDTPRRPGDSGSGMREKGASDDRRPPPLDDRQR
jgi:hypothetical protein